MKQQQREYQISLAHGGDGEMIVRATVTVSRERWRELLDAAHTQGFDAAWAQGRALESAGHAYMGRAGDERHQR